LAGEETDLPTFTWCQSYKYFSLPLILLLLLPNEDNGINYDEIAPVKSTQKYYNGFKKLYKDKRMQSYFTKASWQKSFITLTPGFKRKAPLVFHY
jgi:hypothetical protein